MSQNQDQKILNSGDTSDDDGSSKQSEISKSDKKVKAVIIVIVAFTFTLCSTTIVQFHKLQGIKSSLTVINASIFQEVQMLNIRQDILHNIVYNIKEKISKTRGAKGEKGEVGVRGRSISGETGYPGESGLPGDKGEKGFKGFRGMRGACRNGYVPFVSSFSCP